MQLGTCSWTLGLKDLEQLMSKVKSLGLDGLHFCEKLTDYSPIDVKETAERYGLKIFAIDPFYAKPENSAKATLPYAISYYSEVIDFAVEANSPWVTLQALPKWTINCSSEAENYTFLAEACKKLDAYAKLKKVKLVYEAVNRYESSIMHTALECRNFLDQLEHHEIKIVLDSFHMNIEEADAVKAIQETGDQLASYHISDSNRGGIGSGHIDFIQHFKTLQSINFNGPVIIEVVLPHLAPSTPPRNSREWEQLDNEIKRSVSVWQELG